MRIADYELTMNGRPGGTGSGGGSATPSILPPTGGGGCSTSSSSCIYAVAHDYQDTSYYCVPAAAKAMIGGVASQSYLASQMGTSTTGTQFSHVPGAINPFTSHSYVHTSGTSSFTSSSDLFSHVKYNFVYQGAYLMFAVESANLTYVPAGYAGYHALVGQGWSGSSVSIWDPEYQSYNTATGGVHLQSPSTLYSAELVHGRELIW